MMNLMLVVNRGFHTEPSQRAQPEDKAIKLIHVEEYVAINYYYSTSIHES